MSDSVQNKVYAMEAELLALSANQAPAPRQISTYSHSVNITSDPQIVLATFSGGIKLCRGYTGNQETLFYMEQQSTTVMRFYVSGGIGDRFTVVSLSDFTLS